MNTLPRLRTGLHYEAHVDGYLVSLIIVRGDEMVASHDLGVNEAPVSSQDFNDWLNISVGYLKNYFPELFDPNYVPNLTPIPDSTDTLDSLLEALQDVVDHSNGFNDSDLTVTLPQLHPQFHYRTFISADNVYLSINTKQGATQIYIHFGEKSDRSIPSSEFKSLLVDKISHLKSKQPHFYGPGHVTYAPDSNYAGTLLEALSNFTYSQNHNQDQPDPLTLPKLNEGYSYEISKDKSDTHKFELSMGKVNPITNDFSWKIFSSLSMEEDVQNMTDDELRAELHSAVTYLQSAFPKHFDEALAQPNSAEDRYNSILEEMTTPNNPTA